VSFKEKVRRYFLEQPRPAAVFQISPSYLAALKARPATQFSPGDYFFERLPAGLVEAQLLLSNLKQPEELEELINKAVKKVRPRGNAVTIILPEMSSRVFIFHLERNVLAPAELVKFIEWRLDHQLSRPLSEIRYSYQTFNSGQEKKVLVVCTGKEVADEYEALFGKKKLYPGKLTIPSLSVLNLMMTAGQAADDFLLVEVDLDYLSLIAVIEGSPYLYRQKQLWPDNQINQESILKEAENTLHFIEDKARKRPALVYLRSNLEDQFLLRAEMERWLGAEVVEVMTEDQFLAPLIGGQ
jgi:Tfp pilus assembly PilM family ATPase